MAERIRESAPVQPPSAMTQLLQRRWARVVFLLLTLLLVFVAVTALLVILRFMADRPVEYSDVGEHFKYGSTGGERESGLPYWVFEVMPRVCSQHLPGGYASLGFIYEDGHDLPIGMSMRRNLGMDRTFINCAVCHVSTVRDTPDDKPRIVLGMPANTFDLFGFQRFLFACAADPAFRKDVVVPEIARLMEERGQHLGILDRYIVYPVAVWLMRERLTMLAGRFGPLLEDTPWGPGRTDTFNPNKVLFNFPLDRLPARERNAAVDFPSIWLQKQRQGMQLHWDGNNIMSEERNKNAAFGTGTTPPTIDLHAIGRIEQWLLTAEPPKFQQPIDAALAQRGQPIYAEYCAGCHGANGREFAPPEGETSRDCLKSNPNDAALYAAHVGRITPVDDIGTDRQRLDSFSYDLAVQLGTIYAGYPHRYCHYRKTYGYANAPLDGIWLRAPYLHNGSVPTLRDLLEPADARPQEFYRGDDVYDGKRMGFVHDQSQRDGRKLFLYDTNLPGNSNAGHEGARYGTLLAPEQKDALVEYLKTF
ncbi:c-type cytochrome [Povalibacter sp.]|uniref:c-type cytochrome n=1 Tax=Povalibacter sp. TaxID=1962978 RepID=UPI002F3E426D